MNNPLKTWRVEAGLSQREAGRILGVDHSLVVRLERGAFSPTLRHLRELAEKMRVDPLDLVIVWDAFEASLPARPRGRPGRAKNRT